MRGIWISAAMTTVLVVAVMACGQERQLGEEEKSSPVSFKNDVTPILKKHCLPCHAEENFNPSELSLDSYNNLMAGGKHGTLVVRGKASESMIIQKLGSNPPFGDRMPLIRKKNAASPDKLTTGEIDTLSAWINQGAKDN
jgi:hypothetical protein